MKLFFFALLLTSAVGYAQSGAWQDLQWRLTNQTLVISGNGATPVVKPGGVPPWGYSTLKTIVIDDGVTGISKGAFLGPKAVTSIILGADVAEIDVAFTYYRNLETVEVRRAVPPVLLKNRSGGGTFTGASVAKAKLVVPPGAKAAYQADEQWNKFGSIEEMAADRFNTASEEVISQAVAATAKPVATKSAAVAATSASAATASSVKPAAAVSSSGLTYGAGKKVYMEFGLATDVFHADETHTLWGMDMGMGYRLSERNFLTFNYAFGVRRENIGTFSYVETVTNISTGQKTTTTHNDGVIKARFTHSTVLLGWRYELPLKNFWWLDFGIAAGGAPYRLKAQYVPSLDNESDLPYFDKKNNAYMGVIGPTVGARYKFMRLTYRYLFHSSDDFHGVELSSPTASQFSLKFHLPF
ncbi:MAG: hypothetical protein LBR06_02540 [Bacteroidales bacterium]|nr:hypothetical protein [Bacteroidales bacterium]